MIIRAAILFLLLVAACPVAADSPRAWVAALASPEMGGRLTGTPDEMKSAEYIAAELRKLGVEPLAGRETFLHPFPFIVGQQDFGSRLLVQQHDGATTEVKGVGLHVAYSSPMGKTAAPLSIIGIDLTRDSPPDIVEQHIRRHEVEGRVVLLVGAVPPYRWTRDAMEQPQFMERRPSHWTKAAADAGAKGLLIHAESLARQRNEVPMGLLERQNEQSRIPVFFVDHEFVASSLRGAGRSISPQEMENLRLGVAIGSFSLDARDTTATLDVRVLSTMGKGHNVIGVFKANAPGATDNRPIIIGAHYDHIGDSMRFRGIEREGKRGPIHFGADDNASGVAMVLGIVQRLAVVPRTRDVIVAFWSGEELGLVGSQHFVAHPAMDLQNVAYYMNYDMVGRLRDEGVEIAVYPADDPLLAPAVSTVKFSGAIARLQHPKRLSTDYTSFSEAGVSCFGMFTGLHDDYHKPSDTPDTLNYDGINAVIDYSVRIMRETMNE